MVCIYKKKKFPKLPELTAREFTSIVTNNLSTGKAMAHDYLTDLLFSYKIDDEKLSKLTEEEIENLNPPAKFLKKLWSTDLDNLSGFEKTWEYRLCALNKVFPKTPNRFEMRPINIGSPILKALEARFLPKLKAYLRDKLDRAQTGFVDGMGIFVNLQRAVKRIQLRTNGERKQFCYGLFIDYANAYNLVPHKLLFEKLRAKKVMLEEEINFLEQIYARIKIRIGKHTIHPNRGVAQGSILSPALFNIFIEDLSTELQQKAQISLEDLMFYADDLLALCSSQAQLRKAIEIIKNWSKENGMVLNAKKSGIVVFANYLSQKIPFMKPDKQERKQGEPLIWIPSTKEFDGIPICTKYKYLGTWLDNKLSVQPQIDHIKKKSGHILTRLYPYLRNASAEGRRDMWTTMIKPLFGALFPLLGVAQTKRALNQCLVLWKSTFKSMMLLPRRTPSILVSWMIGKELMEICNEYEKSSSIKWTARKLFKSFLSVSSFNRSNLVQGVPNTWCDIIKKQLSPCKLCLSKGIKNKILSSDHLYLAHGVAIPSLRKIFNGVITPILNGEREWGAKNLRKRIFRRLGPILEMILEMYKIYNL